MINGAIFNSSLVITQERIIPDWRPQTFNELEAADFELLCAEKPDLVLLGTGPQQKFPPASLYESLISAGIGLEIMSTPAACRTYNILIAEGRRVATALLLA